MINYYSECDFDFNSEAETSSWIYQIAQEHGAKIESITFVFMSDDQLLHINQDHLQHDYYTDIITFPFNEDNEALQADIYISIDRVKENAKQRNLSFSNELHRVMIHGVLHLIGFDDKNTTDKEKMRKEEDKALSKL